MSTINYDRFKALITQARVKCSAQHCAHEHSRGRARIVVSSIYGQSNSFREATRKGHDQRSRLLALVWPHPCWRLWCDPSREGSSSRTSSDVACGSRNITEGHKGPIRLPHMRCARLLQPGSSLARYSDGQLQGSGREGPERVQFENPLQARSRVHPGEHTTEPQRSSVPDMPAPARQEASTETARDVHWTAASAFTNRSPTRARPGSAPAGVRIQAHQQRSRRYDLNGLPRHQKSRTLTSLSPRASMRGTLSTQIGRPRKVTGKRAEAA